MWLFAEGSQIVSSFSASTPALVGATGDVDRTPTATGKGTRSADDDTCKINPSYGEGIADAFSATPDVGYIVASSYSEVFFTTNNLATAAAKQPATPATRATAAA